jgi:hypothetical protein
VRYNRYCLIGKTVVWLIYIETLSGTSSLSATCGTVTIATPFGAPPAVAGWGRTARCKANAVKIETEIYSDGGGGFSITAVTPGSFGAGPFDIAFTLMFEVA